MRIYIQGQLQHICDTYSNTQSHTHIYSNTHTFSFTYINANTDTGADGDISTCDGNNGNAG